MLFRAVLTCFLDRASQSASRRARRLSLCLLIPDLPCWGIKYTGLVSSGKPDPSEVSRKRSVAGKRGAQAVKATFGAVITRRRLAELVGVSPNTVRNWEVAGALEPRREEILGSPTVVFEPADVEFGLKLIALLRRHNGQLTVQQAADLVRAGKPFQP